MGKHNAINSNNEPRNASATENTTLHKVKVLKAMKSIGSRQPPSVFVFLSCMYHAIDGHRRLSSEAG
ncbi:hypothetical protein BD410DRAFT_182700 [Rickenella mellea]|uniref:Uncharacterized protein n=1 Tax=Rickenella mellea TaxID=50990 RepID=A0A4Y7Q6G5_9AGAM|nr:hypothetical protein BD410DRAFT_182700 [Rickenella mellea]